VWTRLAAVGNAIDPYLQRAARWWRTLRWPRMRKLQRRLQAGAEAVGVVVGRAARAVGQRIGSAAQAVGRFVRPALLAVGRGVAAGAGRLLRPLGRFVPLRVAWFVRRWLPVVRAAPCLRSV
jgi:hypothetical protein